MFKFLLIFAFPLLAHSLAAKLASGPMLGSVEMREAQIWVQAEEPSIVRIVYTEDGNPQNSNRSVPVETNTGLGNTATISLSAVEPGKTYRYMVELNGALLSDSYEFSTPAYYKGRTPPPDFTIAVGGAHYMTEEGFEPPYQTIGAGYEIFQTIAEAKPELMIWLGNTAHLRESDWSSKSGYLKRFARARSAPGLAKLLAGTPNYAIWGEADYGSPEAGMYYSHRKDSEASFRAFWPRPADIPHLEGIATRFRYADVDFFMLDTQSYRNDTPTSKEPFQILGREQINWLRQELIRSKATFKIVLAGAPILNPAKNRSNLSYAESEHSELLQMFRNENITGLFFISGGKYYGELTRLRHASSYNLFDLTVGPLTANPRQNRDELNFFRMPGSSTFERHFALVDFSGPEDDRSITIRMMSMDGKELWSRKIQASELEFNNTSKNY